MGLFSKKQDVKSSEKVAVAAPDSEELDLAVETMADVIRAFGAHSFAQDGAAALATVCEGWAQHLLVFADPPSGGLATVGAKARQWKALRRVFLQLRKSEVVAANASATTMRDALWVFIRTFARVLTADGTADVAVASQLVRLKAAVNAPGDELRREVSQAVEAIELAVKEKQARLVTESSELAARVRLLSDELEVAKREGATDALTKVANRKAFDEQLERVHELAILGSPATLLMVDLDFFKKVNDELGHPAGDKVLRAVADSLVKTCRRRRDFVARYGGEEFAILLPETSLEEGKALAERACAGVRALAVIDRPLTISIGVAAATRGETKEAWLARADRGLYEAKASGRNRAVLT